MTQDNFPDPEAVLRALPDMLAKAAAKAEAEAEDYEAKAPVHIIAASRRIDRGEGSIADLVGQIEHDAWEAGFETAVAIVRRSGAVQMADDLERALADYWEAQGVERED